MSKHDYTPLSSTAIPSDTPATCVAYLRALRTAIRGGAEWRAAIDSLRETTNELWLRLPLREKKRFRRHLQRRWDVVRHRMAPPIADVIASELRNGTLEIRTGHLKTVDASPAGARITLRAQDHSESLYADRVINCTGPSMNYRRIPSTLLENMFNRGLVTSGPLGTGFHCSRDGAVIDAGGQTSQIIFNLGPGRLGDLLESIAVPEIRQQAVALAATLADRIRQQDVLPERTVTGTATRELEAAEKVAAVALEGAQGFSPAKNPANTGGFSPGLSLQVACRPNGGSDDGRTYRSMSPSDDRSAMQSARLVDCSYNLA